MRARWSRSIPSGKPLSPKVDVVFKLLFSDPRNEALLVSLLTAVMRPSSPIAVVKVMHREVTKEHVEERGLVLDLLVRLADGRRVNVEMQCDMRHALPERWLFHWAKLFAEGISRGEPHKKLTPVVCIAFLDGRVGHRFHAVHRMLEVHDHTPFSDAIEIHTVELPRVAEAEGDELLSLWARFLRVGSEAELASLASEDPIMTQAKEALDRLSSDEDARALYNARLLAQVTLMLEREADEAARRTAEERTRAAEEQTRAIETEARAALRPAIEALCEAFDIALDTSRRALLDSAKLAELTALLAHVRARRVWP